MRFARCGIVGGLALALCAGAAAAASPLGTWKAQNGWFYKYVPLAGGGYTEISLTAHRTDTNHCLIASGTPVFRYHPVGGGIYSVDSHYWHKDCTTYWVNAEEKRRIVVTATRMTLSCPGKYAKVCFTYTRADTAPPKVRALPSAGVVGGVTSLRYTVSDDSGRTWEELTIYQGNSALRHYRTTLGPAVPGRVYGYKLTATPAAYRGTFKFCVVSHDAAGNVSNESCAEVIIR